MHEEYVYLYGIDNDIREVCDIQYELIYEEGFPVDVTIISIYGSDSENLYSLEMLSQEEYEYLHRRLLKHR